jgi:hypothetical protein
MKPVEPQPTRLSSTMRAVTASVDAVKPMEN